MSKTLPKTISVIAPVAIILAGCASIEGDFPPLSKRAYEDSDPLAEPVAAPPPKSSNLPLEMQSKVDALLSRAREAQSAFDAKLPNAAAVAQLAAGTSAGSEAWVNAHMQLSRADAARADAVAALGEIDRLIASERDKDADAGIVELLSAKQTQIAALVESQNAVIERLTKLIGL